jgi:hypothetical protein
MTDAFPQEAGRGIAPVLPTQSPTIGKLAEALAKAQGSMTTAKKDSDNPFFGSRYADLAACWEVCREPLARNGLAIIQTTAPTTDGTVRVVSTLAHTSGEWIRGELAVKPVKADPQGIGSALTYARRYGLCSLVGIVADEDDDGEAAQGRGTSQKPKQSPARQSQAPQGQTKPPTQAQGQPRQTGGASESQIRAIFAISKDKGLDAHHAASSILARTVDRLDSLTMQEATRVIAALNKGEEAGHGK